MKTWKLVVLIDCIAIALAAATFIYVRQVKPAEVQEAKTQTQTAKTAIYEQEKTIKNTRTASCRKIKKAVKQAVEKADSISDNDVCAEFNTVISGARKRNAERGHFDNTH